MMKRSGMHVQAGSQSTLDPVQRQRQIVRAGSGRGVRIDGEAEPVIWPSGKSDFRLLAERYLIW